LSTTQKLDENNYEMSHWKSRYLLNDKGLLEHLIVAKVPPSDKGRDGKQLILLLCSIKSRLRHTRTSPTRIIKRALLCCIACITI